MLFSYAEAKFSYDKRLLLTKEVILLTVFSLSKLLGSRLIFSG